MSVQRKCEQYWPQDSAPAMYHDLMIQLLNETQSELWTVREMSITMVSELLCPFAVRKSSLEVAPSILLFIYSFQFTTAFPPPSACAVIDFPNFAFTFQSKQNIFIL